MRPPPVSGKLFEPTTNLTTFPFKLRKIWDAVVNFFKTIAGYIANWVRTASNFIRTLISPMPNAFKDIPLTNAEFLEKAIQLYEEDLKAKGDPALVDTFNEEWEMLSNIPELALAAVRAYVFSNSPLDGKNLTFFYQEVCEEQGEYNPPVRDPNGTLLYAGGYSMKRISEDHTARLRDLGTLFASLPDREKKAILDKTDFEDIEKMDISNSGKTVLKGISEVAHLLHQKNPPFHEALKAVYERRFPQ